MSAAPALTLVPETPYRWRLDPVGAMRVPGIVFATRLLLPAAAGDRSLEQVANVATLPGIVVASYAMPDVHWGYGFPIGGVAATDVDAGGVVSPGGVGFDISCGVRLLVSPLQREQLQPRLDALMNELGRRIPRGRVLAASGISPADSSSWSKCSKAAPGTRSNAATASRVIWTTARTGARSRTPTRGRSVLARGSVGSGRSAAWGRATTSLRSRSST